MEDHRSCPPSSRGETYDETEGVLKAPPAGHETSCSWIVAAIQKNKYNKLTFNLDNLMGAGQAGQDKILESRVML